MPLTKKDLKDLADELGVRFDEVMAALKKGPSNMSFSDIVSANVVSGPVDPPDPEPLFPAIGSSFITPAGTSMVLKNSDEMLGVDRVDIGKKYIDTSKWITTFWQGSSERTLTGNGEAQYYMDPDYAGQNPSYKTVAQRPNPFEFLSDPNGILQISATRGSPSDLVNWWGGQQRPFYSGMISSMPDIHTDQPYFPTNRTSAAARKGWLFKYGYVEARIKFPGKYGDWGAFWFLSDDTPDGFQFVSPASDYFGRINEVLTPTLLHKWGPEYDRVEQFGHRVTKTSSGYVAVSGESGFFELVDPSTLLVPPHVPSFDLSADWHTYGVEVNAQNLIETFDGKVLRSRRTPDSWNQAGRRWYTIFNQAIGGNWYAQEINSGSFGVDNINNTSGQPIVAGGGTNNCKAWTIDESSLPHKMFIDYVRWYEAP